jgi:hypothetical protein
VSLPKTPSISLAVSGESEHDRRMIAIGLLFIRLVCDCFKPRQQLEAEILVVPTANPKRLTATANRLILAPDERSFAD